MTIPTWCERSLPLGWDDWCDRRNLGEQRSRGLSSGAHLQRGFDGHHSHAMIPPQKRAPTLAATMTIRHPTCESTLMLAAPLLISLVWFAEARVRIRHHIGAAEGSDRR
jgi:hypothetical protein